jgi:predicted small lipoprotein YifL
MKNSFKIAAVALAMTSLVACKGKGGAATDSVKVDSTKKDTTVKVDSKKDTTKVITTVKKDSMKKM